MKSLRVKQTAPRLKPAQLIVPDQFKTLISSRMLG